MNEQCGYDAAYGEWRSNPIRWWEQAAAGIHWDRRWLQTFDATQGPYGRWFVGGVLNTCFNCVDRHVEAGRGGQAALIWDSPMTGQVHAVTYSQLLEQTAKLAGALATLGVRAGDRVLLYMPRVPEAVIAMLACARLGAVHCVVFGGFAAPQLAKRIDDARPCVVVAASCGLEPSRIVPYKPLLDEAIRLSAAPEPSCVILQRPNLAARLIPGRDHGYLSIVAASTPHPPVSIQATDPLYILYTSGTTARPKGVVRDNGGHAVALQRSMSLILRCEGWGRALGPLRCRLGGRPQLHLVWPPARRSDHRHLRGKAGRHAHPAAFWRVCEQHKVQILFTAPTALRAIRQQDPAGSVVVRHDLSPLRALYLAAERCDPATSEWVGQLLDRPVSDHWWQTETGWAITAGLRGVGHLPTQVGAGGRACPGFEVVALDDQGVALARGETVGNLAARLPLPPGCAPTLWEDEARPFKLS